MHLYRYNPSGKACSSGSLTCVFNPLTMQRRYLKGDDQDTSDSSQDSPTEQDFVEYSRLRRLADKGSMSVMYLILGCQCNFRCRYCFVSQDEHRLSWKMIEDGLALLMGQPGTLKHVRFYGGEPLLYSDMIERLIHFNRRRNYEVTYAIPTNGSLITPDLCRTIKENSISIMVSLDGPEEINDEMRVDSRGRGTFARIRRGIELLHRYDIPFQIACTIHNHNIDNLADTVGYLYDEFEPESVNVNHPYSITPVELKMTVDEYVEKFIREMQKCMKRRVVPGDFFEDKVRPFIDLTPPEISCGGCGGHFVLAPPNRIGPCIAAMNDCGSWIDMRPTMANQDVFNTGLFAEWGNRHIVDITDCRDCPAISLCGGGCPYNALTNEGSIWRRDRLDCILTRRTLDLLLEIESAENANPNGNPRRQPIGNDMTCQDELQ